jgi:hypothetical protein
VALAGQLGNSRLADFPLGGQGLRTAPVPQAPLIRFELNKDDNPSVEFPLTGYTDFSYRIRGWSTRRGRSNAVDRIETGVGSVRLDNRDGYFNPGNPGILLLRRARLSAIWDGTTFPLLTGHVESYRYSYPGPDVDAYVDLTLTDGLKVLAKQQLPASFVREVENTAARVPAVLTGAGVGSSYQNLTSGIDPDPLAAVRVVPSDSGGVFTIAATLVDGSATITVASTVGIASGMAISGRGIPIGATVNQVLTGTTFTIKNDATPANGVARLSRFKDTVYPGVAGPWFEIDGIADTTDLSVGMHVGPYYNIDGALLFDHTVTQVLSDRVIVGSPISGTWRGPSDPGGVATHVPFTAPTSTTLTIQKSYLPVAGALDHIRKIEETERGLFLLRADGVYEYQGSGYRAGLALAVTFGENSGEIPYEEVPLVYDDQDLINEYTVTNPYSGAIVIYADTTSQARYFKRSQTIEQIWAANKTKLPTSDRVFEPIPRLEGLRVALVGYADLSDSTRISRIRTLLGLEVSAKANVKRRPRGGADLLAAYAQFVEGISHDGGVDPTDWRMTFVTAPIRP